jgi:fatty-acyl-CoA synthase
MNSADTSNLSQAYWPADQSDPVLEHSVGNALREAAKLWGDRTALVEGRPGLPDARRWSFAALLRDSETVAHALLARFAPGERVAVWAENCPEWVLIEFGAALAGLTLVTVNPALLEQEVRHVLSQSGASGVFVQQEHRGRDLMAVLEGIRPGLPRLRDVVPLSSWAAFMAERPRAGSLPHVSAGDIAQIQYTSGTTGLPKGVRLAHRSIANNARFYARCIGARPDDVWVTPMPLFHTAGCGLATLGALQTGGANVLQCGGFDPAGVLDLLEAERGTVVLCVPTMLIRMLDQAGRAARDVSAWRLLTLGGAPVPPELVRRAQKAFGAKVAIGFGQTEASPYITHTLPDDPHPDSFATVGRPLPQLDVKVMDPDTGETLPVNSIGELCVRGYSVMAGYFENPEATAETLDAEGWLHTGDLGSMDHQGYCRIQGRLRDMIIRGGENVYPREVEDVLFTHPDVSNAAVVGVPDSEWGESVAAFIQMKGGQTLSETELAAFCRERLASFKVPRIWRQVEGFPQTASGKVQKFMLRQELRPG